MKPRKPPNPKNPIKPTRSTLARETAAPKPPISRRKKASAAKADRRKLFDNEQREVLIRLAVRMILAGATKGELRVALDAKGAEISNRVSLKPGHVFMLSKEVFQSLVGAAQDFIAHQHGEAPESLAAKQLAALISTQQDALRDGDRKSVVDTNREIRKLMGLDRPTRVDINVASVVMVVDTVSAILLKYADRIAPEVLRSLADELDAARIAIGNAAKPVLEAEALAKAAAKDPDAWDDDDDQGKG